MNASAFVGTSLAGYRLGEVIDQLDKTMTHRARDEASGRNVALRIRPLDTNDEPGDIRRMEREAALAASVDHANIIEVHDSGRELGILWTAMELIEGESLRQLLNREGPLAIERAMALVGPVLSALATAHEKDLLHRHLKADNIYLTTNDRVKIGGFGSCSSPSGAVLTGADEDMGAIEFLAPEQVLGDPVGPAADLYAVGVLLFELLTGTKPHVGSSPAAQVYHQLNEEPHAPSALRAGIPAALDQLVLALLDKLPEQRPPGAAVALRELEAVARQHLASASQAPGTPVEHEAPPTRGDRSAFVGREGELVDLSQHLAELASAGRMVFIAGEAGVGKTRLAMEAQHRARAAGARTITGNCLFDNGLGPYTPFMSILSQLLRVDEGGLGEHEGQAIRAQLQALNLAALTDPTTTPAQVLARLCAVFGTDNGTDAVRLRFFDAVFDLLAAAAASRPLVLVIEDLHWSDTGSINLLEHLAHRVSEAPILLLATFCPEDVPADGELAGFLTRLESEGRLHRFELERLNVAAVQHLAESLFPEADLTGEFADLLFAQSQGNPFIAIEVLKLLRSQGVLLRDDGVWRVDPGFAGQVLPERVSALVLRRINALSTDERELLQLAAVIGQRFTIGTLEAVSGTARIPLLKLLFRLEKQHRLITVEDGTYEFAHAKIREVLYEELPWELRREYHRSVANLEHGADAELGHHLFRAERFAEALPCLERAALGAQSLYSWREAAALFDQVTEACQATDAEVDRQLQSLRAASRCYANLAAFDEARQRLTKMQAVAITTGRTMAEADAVTQMGRIDLRNGRFEDAVTAFAHAVDLISWSTDRAGRGVYGEAVLMWGVADFENGRYDVASERWQEARELLRDHPVELSNCMNNLAVLATVRGDLDGAWELYQEVLDLDQHHGSLEQMALTHLNLSMVRSDQERWDDALELSARSLDLCRQSRVFAHEPMIQLSRAEAFLGRGDMAGAEQSLTLAQRGFRRLDDALGAADALRLQGSVCRHQQRWEEGRELLGRCIDINRKFGESVSLGEALYELAELNRAAGEPAAAIEPLQEAEGIFARAEAQLDLDRVRIALQELRAD